jgi:hypothetical protein
VLVYLAAFYLFVLLCLTLLIIKRNGLKNKSVASIMLFLVLGLSVKLCFYAEEYKAKKNCEKLYDETGLYYTMLIALPVLFFMMASLLNLNYWINFYLSADRKITEYDRKPFNKKLYNKRIFFLNYITGSLIAVLILYVILLGAFTDR